MAGELVIYRLRAVHRDANGIFSPPLHEHPIRAEDTSDAVRLARAVDLDMDALGANALFLVDEAGNVVWSLRRDDRLA